MATLDKSYDTGDDAASSLRNNTASYKFAQQFTPTQSGSVDQADIKIYKAGTPTGNIWVEIWSDNGSDLPNAQLGGDSNVVDVSTLGAADGAFVTFTWSSNLPPIVASTKYWLVWDGDFAESATDNAKWRVDTDGSGGSSPGASARADNLGAWSALTPNVYMFKEYFQPVGGGGGFFYISS